MHDWWHSCGIVADNGLSLGQPYVILTATILSVSLFAVAVWSQLLESPVFYLKTVISVLISAVKNEKGASQEHALGNLSNLIQPMWPHIAEKDRWQIGNAYRDVTAAGNVNAAKGLKNALLKVKGFDYVPENLRSTTFKKAAKALFP